jgi:adenine-specific DNA-methyltransferase
MAIEIQQLYNIQNELLSTAELIRIQTSSQLDPTRQKKFSQFFTPLPIASYMASLFSIDNTELNILDPGAGIGILSAALIDRIIKDKNSVRKLNLTAFETDNSLISQLNNTLDLCRTKCDEAGIELSINIINDDFIQVAADSVKSEIQLFPVTDFAIRFDSIIMNPPYKKIQSGSLTRRILSSINIETSNLYSAFLALSIKLLKNDGQLVAITPRSFTNGPYFKAFRNIFYSEMSFADIHVFNSRNQSFSDVLQENIIFHAYKSKKLEKVVITSSDDPTDEIPTQIELSHNNVINPSDPNKIIYLITDKNSERVIERIKSLPCALHDLDIQVSTGRVVDFRANNYLLRHPSVNSVPLIYPLNFEGGNIVWPIQSKKPNSIIFNKDTDELLLDNGYYALCKRFSSKEERRRIVAALFNPQKSNSQKIGFENHLNVFHNKLNGLDEDIAKGLTVFLNSTIIDLYFRIFNGHTQVNAADLRMLRYPSVKQLKNLSKYFLEKLPSQDKIDKLIEKELFNMAKDIDPVKVDKKIKDALNLLRELGLPLAQQNERSALTLLALLDLKPNRSWKKSSDPLIGITEMMIFFKDNYGKVYAPNSRETVRRFTVHQFVQAGLALPNSDKPRPVNSLKYVYQIEPSVLKLIREYRTKSWKNSLKSYLPSVGTLKQLYAQERELQRIPIKLSDKEILLSPGGQNILVKKILDDFCSRFTPNADPIYIGDAEKKGAYFNQDALKDLGVAVPDEHGKIPDLVIHFAEKNWLILIEAVTSHGPINAKRKIELEELFKGSKIGLVFVTAFLDRRGMLQYLNEIAWETEIWVAESPSHLIHFNGKRFLGPYVK